MFVTLCSPACTGPLSALSGLRANPVSSRGRTQIARVCTALTSWCVADTLSKATYSSSTGSDLIECWMLPATKACPVSKLELHIVDTAISVFTAWKHKRQWKYKWQEVQKCWQHAIWKWMQERVQSVYVQCPEDQIGASRYSSVHTNLSSQNDAATGKTKPDEIATLQSLVTVPHGPPEICSGSAARPDLAPRTPSERTPSMQPRPRCCPAAHESPVMA